AGTGAPSAAATAATAPATTAGTGAPSAATRTTTKSLRRSRTAALSTLRPASRAVISLSVSSAPCEDIGVRRLPLLLGSPGLHAIKRAMALLEWLIVAAAVFGGLVALVYAAQRSLMYFPERLHTPPAMAGFPEAQEVALDTKDGERVIVWHLAPRGEKPVVL